MLIRASLLVAFGAWLAASASDARAMHVTWRISGTASTGSESLPYFPNDSPYVLTITFETETPPTNPPNGLATGYDGAIVAATFESATYSPEIELAPPALSRITVSLFDTWFYMGGPGLSDEHPSVWLTFPNGGLVPPASGVYPLPIAPPDSAAPLVEIQIIGAASPYQILYSNVAPSSIDYSVREPAIAWASAGSFAIAWLRTMRRKRTCTETSDSRFS